MAEEVEVEQDLLEEADLAEPVHQEAQEQIIQ
jgi:hypothetical protein